MLASSEIVLHICISNEVFTVITYRKTREIEEIPKHLEIHPSD